MGLTELADDLSMHRAHLKSLEADLSRQREIVAQAEADFEAAVAEVRGAPYRPGPPMEIQQAPHVVAAEEDPEPPSMMRVSRDPVTGAAVFS